MKNQYDIRLKLDNYGRSSSSRSILEVISVGGKGFFSAYSKVLRACEIRYSIIADLDYIEQVGLNEISPLFQFDGMDIKKDVIENVKSLDGDALIQAIDQALSSRSWDHATQIWSYIKARRRKLRKDLSQDEALALDKFLTSQKTNRVYILRCGALESYLPVGHSSKDLDKLIRLLAQDDLWERLPKKERGELEVIAKNILLGE